LNKELVGGTYIHVHPSIYPIRNLFYLLIVITIIQVAFKNKCKQNHQQQIITITVTSILSLLVLFSLPSQVLYDQSPLYDNAYLDEIDQNFRKSVVNAEEVSGSNIIRKFNDSNSDTNSTHTIRDSQDEGARANLVVGVINLNESLTEQPGGIISVNPKNNLIYLMDSDSNSISIIDGTTNSLLKNEIKLGHFVGERTDFSDPRTELVYVTQLGDISIELNEIQRQQIQEVLKNTNSTQRLKQIIFEMIPFDIRKNVTTYELWRKNATDIPTITIPSLAVYTINSTNNAVVDNFTNILRYEIDIFYLSDTAIIPETNMIYFVYKNGTVSTMNFRTNSLTTNINVGGNYYRSGILNELAVDPDTNKVYVTNAEANRVSVMNGSNLDKLADISVPRSPYALAVDPDTNKVYVTNAEANRVSVIDSKTDIVSKNIVINYTSPSNQEPKLAIDANTNLVYLATSKSNLYVIDPIKGSVVGNFILERILSDVSDIDINPTTNAVYLTSLEDDSIVVINGKRDNIFAEATKTLRADYTSGINTGSQPTDVAVNLVNNIIYVANFGSTITAIDGNNDSIISSHTIDNPPYKIALNPSLNTFYILKPDSNSLSVFDGSMKTMKKNFTVGMNSTVPDGLFINPTNGANITSHNLDLSNEKYTYPYDFLLV
jgi:YVTN family beta-propeller protein